jgi:hypothetical protein
MIYTLLALFVVLLITIVYYKSDKFGDKYLLLKYTFVISIGIFFTYISKVLFIHKPIFIVHLALVFVSWYGIFNYIKKERFNYLQIFSPALTSLLFFILAIFFKEYA